MVHILLDATVSSYVTVTKKTLLSRGPNKKYKVMRPQIYINLATWLCEGRHLWFEDINLIMRREAISEYKLMRPQIYINLTTWLCERRLLRLKDINILPHSLLSLQYFLINQKFVRIHKAPLVVTVKGCHIHLHFYFLSGARLLNMSI